VSAKDSSIRDEEAKKLGGRKRKEKWKEEKLEKE